MKSIVTTELQYGSGTNQARSNFLNPGQYLRPGDQLTSQNGLFTLRFQADDSNIVLYDWNNVALWATGSPYDDNPRPVKLIYQTDGNLVSYDANNNVVWAAYPVNFGLQAGQLILMNNGNLVSFNKTPSVEFELKNLNQANLLNSKAYAGLPNIPPLTRNALYGKVNTAGSMDADTCGGDQMRTGDILVSSNGLYCLRFEETGELIVYDWNWNVWWRNNATSSQPGGWVHMRPNGEFCVCVPNPGYFPGMKDSSPHQIIWSTANVGHGVILGNNPYLILQDDGNLVVYADPTDGSNNPKVLWASNKYQAVPQAVNQLSIKTTLDGHLLQPQTGDGFSQVTCGGVAVKEVGGCATVLNGVGFCGAVYSGANFTGVSVSGTSACGARASLVAICGAVAAGAGASVVSVTGAGGCGAVANLVGVCGAVVTGAGACGGVTNGIGAAVFGVAGEAICGAAFVVAKISGADEQAAGGCIEASGAGACGANAVAMEGTGVCGLQVGFCGVVACVAFPIGGNW